MSVVSSKLVDALAKANVDQEFLDLLEAELRKIRVPVGAIMPYRGTTPPEGWLIVNGQNVYESVYPDLYNFLKAQPNAKTGTDGTGAYVKCELPHHRVIELTTTLSEVGQLVEAGLPDISGEFRGYGSGSTNNDESGKWYGAISIKRSVPNKQVELVSATMYSNQDFLFLASKSNALFGKASINQMASLRLMAIIKA